MPVVLFNLDSSEGNKARSREEAERTISTLDASQRPTLLSYSSPKEILVPDTGVDLLASKMELNELEGFPLAIDLDTHYFLNSKAAICASSLPRYFNIR